MDSVLRKIDDEHVGETQPELVHDLDSLLKQRAEYERLRAWHQAQAGHYRKEKDKVNEKLKILEKENG